MRVTGAFAAVLVCISILFVGGCGANADDIRAELAKKHCFISEKEYQQGFVTTLCPGQIVYAHNYVYFTKENVS